MQFGFRAKALTLAELNAIVNPAAANQPEVVPALLYSTRTYPAAGVALLNFFDGGTADQTLDNVANNQLPAPQFFREWQWFCDFLTRLSTSATTAGRLDDIGAVLNIARGLLIHQISQKDYLQVPLRALGAIGGPFGQLSSTVAAVSQQNATNGLPGWSPFHVNGMIVIPPQTNFTARVQFVPAIAVTADLPIALEIYGELYRRVL